MAGSSVLVVPPFDCAWLMGDDQSFLTPGRGCVAFEARAANDVTVVFKDQPGCKHYRTDMGANYTIILGSHCNRRLKFLVDGKTVVDVAGIVLLPSAFERYWISVHDGCITVGKGEPGQTIVYEWADPSPNCKIKYVGLSSWDKHVGYRNVKVLPPAPVTGNHNNNNKKYMPNSHDLQGIGGGLAPYLESPEFSDLQFEIGHNRKVVRAHRVLLASACTGFAHFDGDVIHLPSVTYPILHAFLQYIYTGHTLVPKSDLSGLQELAEKFGLNSLVLQCRELKLALTQELEFDAKLELTYQNPVTAFQDQSTCALNIPVNAASLVQHLDSGEFSDVDLSVEDYDTVARAHRLILSAWSEPFAKMFTNGMCESSVGQVLIKDTEPEVFLAMLWFMYRGHLDLEERSDYWALLLPLLVLADQFAVQPLQQECCLRLLDCLVEDSACAILQVASTMPNCKALRDACEDCCARHFVYCIIPPAGDFLGLEASCVSQILQHPALSVILEEKVLDAIMMWGANKNSIHGWADANEAAKAEGAVLLFQARLEDVKLLLPLVRFPLVPLPVLQMLQVSELCKLFPGMEELVGEAIEYLCQDLTSSTLQQQEIFQSLDMRTQGRLVKFPRSTVRFSQRVSTFKELLYISDGDCNGVFYYLGTSSGQHPWMNPVLTKKLVVSASSPPSRFTDPKALVSRNYQGTSFAGPCNENGHMSAWWKVDLGVDQQLLCNYYTVRQDSSSSFMRHWSLQGSMDGQHWTQLRTHHNDQTISHGGQYASWPVFGANALLPFRFFRVVLLGPTASLSTPWNLSLCYLELYGYFR